MLTMDEQSPHPRKLPGPTTPKAQVFDGSLILSPPPGPTRNATTVIRKDYGKASAILGLGIEECMVQLGLYDDEHHYGDPTTASPFPSLPRFGGTITAAAGMNHENDGVVMFGLLSAPTRLVRPRVQRFRSSPNEATRGGATATRIHDMTLPAPLFPSLTAPSDRSAPVPFIPKLTESGTGKWKLETRLAKMDDSLLAI